MATHHVNEKTNEPIEVSENDMIEVALDANPTTGYEWVIEEMDSNITQLISQSYQPYEGAGVGGGGQKIFNFKVLKNSPGHIKFENVQKWSEDVYKTFAINYTVE